MHGKFLQDLLAIVSQLYQYLSPIIGGSQAHQESPFDEAIDQTYSAVRFKLHPIRQHADGWS
jgi:hypothetical protein